MIVLYVKGDDKKQAFNMLLGLYTWTEEDGSGELIQSIEDTGVGYVGEFNDISNEKVTMKMDGGMLDCNGDYDEQETEVTLK